MAPWRSMTRASPTKAQHRAALRRADAPVSLMGSPDGRTLAFSSDLDPSGAFHVYTVQAAEDAESKRIDASQSVWPQQIMWRPR